MKKSLLLSLLLYLCLSCTPQDRVNFTQEALGDVFLSFEGPQKSFQEILDTYKGRTILIDIWATWCKDCIIGIPKLKEIQREHPEVVYLFLSIDKNMNDWKNGIARYQIQGDHYFLPKGWKSTFGKSIDLDWIPRYVVLGKDGKMSLFEATKTEDKRITELLK